MRHLMTTAVLALVVAVALAFGPGQSRAQEAKDAAAKGKAAQQGHPLVGTWKLVSAKYGENVSDLPTKMTMLKHVTPTQFMWAIYDGQGKVEAALGGPCTVKGDEYVETPEYGVGACSTSSGGSPRRSRERSRATSGTTPASSAPG
jgi:hypothetical protein